MRKFLCCLLVLPILLSLCASAPADGWDFMSNHMKIEAYIDGQWTALAQAMYYSHEGVRFADGFLMFMSVEQYLEEFEIQEATLTEDFSCRFSYDDYIESFECSRSVYRQEEGKLVFVKTEGTSYAGLSRGRYLVAFSFYARRLDEYYKGECFLWLNVE